MLWFNWCLLFLLTDGRAERRTDIILLCIIDKYSLKVGGYSFNLSLLSLILRLFYWLLLLWFNWLFLLLLLSHRWLFRRYIPAGHGSYCCWIQWMEILKINIVSGQNNKFVDVSVIPKKLKMPEKALRSRIINFWPFQSTSFLALKKTSKQNIIMVFS